MEWVVRTASASERSQHNLSPSVRSESVDRRSFAAATNHTGTERTPMDSFDASTPYAMTPYGSTPCPSEQVAAQAIMAPWHDSLDAEQDEDNNRFKISFRASVIGSIIVFTLLTCALMFVQLERSTQNIREEATNTCTTSLDLQRDLADDLMYQDVANASFRGLLLSMSGMVDEFVRAPADRAVDALVGSMRTFHILNESWNPRTVQNIDWLSYRSWVELDMQWGASAGGWEVRPVDESSDGLHRGGANSVSVVMASGEHAGVLVNPYTVLECPLASPHICGSCEGLCTLLTAYEFTAPAGVNDSTDVRYWQIMTQTGATYPAGIPPEAVNYKNVSAYVVQEKYLEKARNSPEGAASWPSAWLWSELEPYLNSGYVTLSRTAPVAHCGNYSCFEGVVSAQMVLRDISTDCQREWETLASRVEHDFNYPLSNLTSTLFIVHIPESFPDQRGLLIGMAHMELCRNGGVDCSKFIKADEAEQAIVRQTSQALLAKFTEWNATELREDRIFHFQRNETDVTSVEKCTEKNENCLQVGTMSIELDLFTRWLVVAVLPANAFTNTSQTVYNEVQDEVNSQREATEESMEEARLTAVIIFVSITLVTIGIGAIVGCLVSQPLQKLSHLMRQLGDLDFNRESPELDEMRGGRRARIKDISDLQNAFCRLLTGVEAFTKFVPETVVTRIVRGDRRATRLHVDKKEVTIMFLKLGDFAKVTEALKDELLPVLTRFFTVMTRVAEWFEGSVSEILDDGLLVYWNTPAKVTAHADKACKCAMGLVHAMELLNQELDLRIPRTEPPLEVVTHTALNAASDSEAALVGDLSPSACDMCSPRGESLKLSVQIGIHTGKVLSGNIGSDMKMKFGCMGDSVNLCSRLQGLCKVYGVNVLCSGVTHGVITARSGLLVRKLDIVKVKGRSEPTDLFEVIGKGEVPDCPADHTRTDIYSEATLERSMAERSAQSDAHSVFSRPRAWARITSMFSGASTSNLRGSCESMQAPTVIAKGVTITSPSSSVPQKDGRSEHGDCEEGKADVRRAAQSEKHLRQPGASKDPTLPTLMGRSSTTANINQNVSPRHVSHSAFSSFWSRSSRGGVLTSGSPTMDFHGTSGSAYTGGAGVGEDMEVVSPGKREYALQYEESLDKFRSARFIEARDGFTRCLKVRPNDKAAQKLFERSLKYISSEGVEMVVGPDWTGVESLTQK